MPPDLPVHKIIARFASRPENAALIAKVRAERDAGKPSRRLPTPPRKQIPSSGRRGKR